MMRSTRPQSNSWWDLIAAVMSVLIIGGLLTCHPQPAKSATICHGPDCNRVIKQVVQQPVYPPVYYSVGQQLQQQAVATHDFRASDEYQELQQLRAWRAGFEAARQTLPPPAEPVPNATGLAQSCAKCHSGDEPAGGMWFDDLAKLRDPVNAEKRDAAVREILNGRMPKKGELTDEQITGILLEIYQDEPE